MPSFSHERKPESALWPSGPRRWRSPRPTDPKGPAQSVAPPQPRLASPASCAPEPGRATAMFTPAQQPIRRCPGLRCPGPRTQPKPPLLHARLRGLLKKSWARSTTRQSTPIPSSLLSSSSSRPPAESWQRRTDCGERLSRSNRVTSKRPSEPSCRGSWPSMRCLRRPRPRPSFSWPSGPRRPRA